MWRDGEESEMGTGRIVVALAVAALVASACGGGGGDDGDEPPGSIDISAGNQQPVTRAAMVTVQGGAIGGSLGIASDGTASPQAVRRVLLAGAKAREGRAGVLGPTRVDCSVSGFATVSLDDRDDNQQPSVGDVLSVSFSACSESAGETLDGSMSATYTQITPSPLSVGASVSVNNLAATDATHSEVLDGDFAFTVQEVNANVATLRMVVGNALALRVTTPVYTDTVTMRGGYTVDVNEDLSAVPAGGGSAGRTTTTVSGKLSSSAAGGTVQIGTLDPIVQYTDDAYPRSGRIEAVGKNGSLQATVLSASQVRIEVDANGDGAFDGSTTLPWTDLL